MNAESMSQVSLIAAIADGGVIGRDNQLPWHVKSDLANFRNLTWKKPVIMGRKTFDSLRAPLGGRRNIVVTRDPTFNAEGIDIVRSIEEGLDLARGIPADEIMIIGGEQIFEATLHTANRMYLTFIHKMVDDGDAFFPRYDPKEWSEVERRTLPTAPDEPTAEFVTFERANTAA